MIEEVAPAAAAPEGEAAPGAAEPEVIYIPGYYLEVALIAKQARALGLNQPLLGGDGWDAPELWQLGGDALNNSYITTHYSPDDPSPRIQEFVQEYKQRYQNVVPDAHAALAYDAMMLLFDAIKRAAPQLDKAMNITDKRDAIRQAMSNTKNFEGLTGKWSFDENGDTTSETMSGFKVVKADNPIGCKFEFETLLE